jgi:ribose transport system substrate-binding protein
MKRFSPLFSVLGATAAFSLALTGCNQPSTQTTQNGDSTAGNTASNGGGSPEPSAIATVGPDEKITVAFVTNNTSDFWTIAKKGCAKADAELKNLDFEFRMPANGTAAEQQNIVNDLLAKGVKGIAISPTDPANQTQMLNKTAEQAVLLTQDSDAPKSKRACYVGTDNKAAGRQAGEEIKKALPNGGKIMVFVGMKDAQNGQDRFNGIKEVLQGSKVEIIDLRTDDTDRTKAKANASDTLVKYPDVAALVGLWSYNGPAILGAVKDAGKIGKVKIICFDEETPTLAGVRSGAISATVVQQPYKFGYESLKLMDKILREGAGAIPDGNMQIVPTKIINKSNVDAFEKELKVLRAD